MKKLFISLLTVVLFPAVAFPQFLCQDTISLKRNSEVVLTESEIDSTYENLYSILPVNDNSAQPCRSYGFSRKFIFPIYPDPPYPYPFSVTNKHHIHIEQNGVTRLAMTDHDCNIRYIMDLGYLEKGSEVWCSPSEVMVDDKDLTTLFVILDGRISDKAMVSLFNEISEGLEIGWKPDDIYPNCTLVKMADTSRTNNNNFDFMFELKEEYPFTILELLDFNDKLIRYFFRMYLDRGIYGVYFSRIDSAYQPLEYGYYKLRLTIADSTYICNFKIIE